jgi:hypothetical protein
MSNKLKSITLYRNNPELFNDLTKDLVVCTGDSNADYRYIEGIVVTPIDIVKSEIKYSDMETYYTNGSKMILLETTPIERFYVVNPKYIVTRDKVDELKSTVDDPIGIPEELIPQKECKVVKRKVEKEVDYSRIFPKLNILFSEHFMTDPVYMTKQLLKLSYRIQMKHKIKEFGRSKEFVDMCYTALRTFDDYCSGRLDKTKHTYQEGREYIKLNFPGLELKIFNSILAFRSSCESNIRRKYGI